MVEEVGFVLFMLYRSGVEGRWTGCFIRLQTPFLNGKEGMVSIKVRLCLVPVSLSSR